MKRIVFIILLFAGVGQPWPVSGRAVTDAELPSLRYRVSVRGVSERRLGVAFQHLLNTWALQDRPPPNLAMLERRAEADVPRLRRALEARGYYAAEISIAIEDSAGRLPRVIFQVRRGERYRIGTIALMVNSADPADPARMPPAALRQRLEAGRPALAEAILAAESAVSEFYRENGFPFAAWTERVYWLDHEERRLHGRLLMTTGPAADFGATTISGNRTVRTDHLRKLLPWRVGEPFDAGRIAMAQRNLTRGALFASAVIMPGDALDADGRLPMTITVRERPHRSVGVGVRYRTDEGGGGNLQWTHRNLAGAGEQVSLTIDGSEIRTLLAAEARKPAFRRHDQQLVGRLTLTDERPEAFSSRYLLASLQVEREPRRFLHWSLGGRIKTARTRQSGETEHSTLFGIPLRTVYDTREDPLDPLRGMRLEIETVPMLGLPDADLWFLKTRPVIGAVYPLGSAALRLAVQTRWSMITGAAHHAIPADERYYAGGGGSVRGYAYQSLGPDRDGHVEGGRSMIENSVELRWRFSDRIGWCGFVDAGQAYRDSWPRATDWAWGIGIGVRYYLPRIGPIRFDTAIPLDRRRDRDDPYQFYLSLGQAF